ncbi:AMP-binding protein [Nocardioides luteus]|uniref:AMP-binding protein n=1 Tax=Nocardioides luteus TaxID=1844 RepID=UPI0018CA7801|nr:AMP-binding protein [Nocardioides luteus]MBG6097094.1 acyl-CoA synthetase (AMP-forming)/AMP-acid ligase II [Nocardioides luteus]
MSSTIATGAHLLLNGRPGDPAVITAEATLTYAELEQAVTDRVAAYGPAHGVVLLEAGNDLDSVIGYLAALAARRPVLLTPPGSDLGELRTRYQAAFGGTAEIHPDLALLLSTSGSTGSPKLVRLSRGNLAANAASIAAYLGLTSADRAMSSLPLHYCYGLSVLNSHLSAGAAVILTDLSVADECFWDVAARNGATSFAGVPYTFDLLDTSGFAERSLPSLRYITQAGGKMPPETVRRYAALGESRGWDLVVMYGQTEATARMAYLPPDLAASRPEAIGIPIPGGHFRLDPVDGVGEGVGELVYTGPNVMMGYAESVGDLARGPELTELRTGDLGRQADDGLWEITGRRSRFGKVLGLRLDLDRIESELGPGAARVVAPGGRLHLFTSDPGSAAGLPALVGGIVALPRAAVQVHRIDEMPRTPNGKVDYATLNAWASMADAAGPPDAGPAGAGLAAGADAEALRTVYAAVLGRPDATVADSFVSLGGDSLSFVEIATQLGERLGTLPTGWQHRSITELAASARSPRRWLRPVEIPVLLRAVAIVAIVGSHADVWTLLGGAHILLAVAGFNLARFGLTAPTRVLRARRLLRGAAAVALPAGLWVAAVALVSDRYHWPTALGLNQALGSDEWTRDWQLWFLEVITWSFAGLALLLLVPVLDRWQRRHRFSAAVGVVGVTLAVRYLWVGLEAGATERYTIGCVLWCVALGWAAAEAQRPWQRVLVAGLVVVATYGFFGDPVREATVALGILVLLVPWPALLPWPLARLTAVLAASSLWIYLTHWQVYPGLEAAGLGWLGVLASLAAGVAVALGPAAWVARARVARLTA